MSVVALKKMNDAEIKEYSKHLFSYLIERFGKSKVKKSVRLPGPYLEKVANGETR